MNNERTIVLCNKKTDYFFEEEATVCGLLKKPAPVFMRAFHKLGIHRFDSFFWGQWKKKLKVLDNIIIFDLCYYPGLEKLLSKQNRKINVYLFLWNPIITDYTKSLVENFYKKENIFSTCYSDCEKYGIKFAQIPYSKKWANRFRCRDNNKAIWIGANKGRSEFLHYVDGLLLKAGCETDIRIVGGEKTSYPHPNKIDYFTYCNLVSESSIVIDIAQKGQSGLTLRVPEAIYFQKKLITNNRSIKRVFPHGNQNVFLIDSAGVSVDELKAFVKRDFVSYDNDTMNLFDFDNWISTIVNKQ